MIRELPNVEQSYGAELARKAIHLCSLSIPIVYYYIPQTTALAILIPLTLIAAGSDYARFRFPAFGTFYSTYLGWLLRSHERDHDQKRFNGATYVLLSAVLCVLLFPKVITITAFAILIISDTLAALVGRKYGRRRFLSKSLEGAAAFLLSALVVVAFTPKILYLPGEYIIGVIGALVGTVVESASIAIDDNLSIPLAIGAVMWLMYLVFLPSVDMYALM